MAFKRIRRCLSWIIFSCLVISASTTYSAELQSSELEIGDIFVEDFSDATEYTSRFSYGYTPADGLAVDRFKNFSWQYGIGRALFVDSEKTIELGEKFYCYPQTTVSKQGKNCFSLTEFDIHTEKTDSSYDIYLTSSQSPGRFFGIIRVTGGAISILENEAEDGSASAFTEPVQFTEDEWHHIRVLMRCTNERAEACSVLSSVSVDGISIFNSTTERSLENYKSKLKYYDMICVQNRQGISGGYIDNISVRRLTNYTGSGIPADPGKLLYQIRKTADFLHEYSFIRETSSYQKLKQAYDLAIDRLKTGGTATEYHNAANDLKQAYEKMFPQQENIQIKEVHYTNDGAVSAITVDNQLECETAMVVIGFYRDDILTDCRLVSDVQVATGLSTIDFETPVVIDDTSQDIRLFLWSEALQAMTLPVRILRDTLNDNLDIRVDSKLYFTDAQAKLKADGTVYVPAENILNLLGATMVQQTDKDYRAERIDGKFLDFTIGSDKITVLDGEKNAGIPYIFADCLPMISMDGLCDAFGCTYTIDQANNTLLVTSNYTENLGVVREPYANELDFFNVGYGSFGFKINAGAAADVEVYTRVDQGQAEGILSIDEEDGETKETYGGWSMPLESVTLWKKSYDLTYQNGGWIGSFSGIRPNSKYYDVLYRITKDGRTETVLKKRAVTLPGCYPPIETVVYDAESLKLVPTFENISYYYTSDQKVTAEVYYKKKTESTWKKGFQPTYDARLGQYLGSITNLTPNTIYDVKLLLDGNQVSGTVSMWDENPPCKEISLSDIYDGGTLVLQGLKGTEDEWIKIVGDKNTVVDGGPNNWEAVYISDCENLILENITVVGGKRYGISISGGSKNVRISNCDISRWGRLGVWNDISHTYRLNFSKVNYDSGITLVDADNVVVERCYIHDCNARTNTWRGKDYTQIHPAGGSAIYTQMGSGLVVRYNDFIGNSVHRWNDVIEGAFNSSNHAGIGFDADIYGNMFFGSNDDAMELDGGSMNVRVYQNRIEQSYCGISFAPIHIGPVYIFGNLIYNLGDRETISSTPTKQGSVQDNGNGQQFWFNNTFIARRNSRVLNTTAYNNVIVSDVSVYALPQARLGDYNLMFGKVKSYAYHENEILGKLPGFQDYLNGNFSLKKDSPAKGSGTKIDNFMDSENPDMGVSAYTGILPARPVALTADKTHLNLSDRTTKTVTIQTGEIEEGLDFSIEKSDADSWFTVSGDLNGVADSNKEYKITVTTDMDAFPKEAKIQNDDLSGAIVFRLSNGFSIPITVRCHR